MLNPIVRIANIIVKIFMVFIEFLPLVQRRSCWGQQPTEITGEGKSLIPYLPFGMMVVGGNNGHC